MTAMVKARSEGVEKYMFVFSCDEIEFVEVLYKRLNSKVKRG